MYRSARTGCLCIAADGSSDQTTPHPAPHVLIAFQIIRNFFRNFLAYRFCNRFKLGGLRHFDAKPLINVVLWLLGAHHGCNATTQQRKFSYCVGLWMVLSLAGCDQNRSIESFAVADAGSAPSKTSSVLDVGIELSDRPGYTCIPLDLLENTSSAEVSP